MLPRKSVVNTFALIKIEGCHFTCKTANKRLHVEEWVKMAKMNKDDPFPCLVIPVNRHYQQKKTHLKMTNYCEVFAS